jgi:asparagine synthase (glutamine-hydrolysing)
VDRLPALVGRQLTRQAAEHGIELRQPLRDHRLIEFAATLPPDQVFRAGQWKFVLRNAMAGRLPGEVLSHRRKIVPDSIFRRGLWERERDRVRDLFVDMRAADLGLVEPATLRAAYERYFEGPGGDSRFWQALTLESWLRRHW